MTKKDFWNQTISSWEKNKYKKTKYFDFNSSVKFRLQMASYLLNQFSKKTKYLELGCGSGYLWKQINPSCIESYRGVDFSNKAIESFQKEVKKLNKTNQVSLFCEDCTKNIYPAEIVVSLGLLDWISTDKIKLLAKNYKSTWFLHSFSEKRNSLSQWIHHCYSLWNYKAGSPYYRSSKELLFLFGPQAKIYRHPKLSFGAFIYNLPKNIKFKC
ncbi:MAG: class I SAM-dependent methyltransferase [Bdellovibrionales bacterium]|nr:class I SAM-dependent methyltransferase [Bdellovibrionales bacterium]